MDYQGNVVYEYHPDFTRTNWYNDLGQLYATGDGRGLRYFSYNNQGLLTNSSSAYGTEKATVYDIENRPVYMTDANGVMTTNTFDILGRLLTRGFPDTGVEHFGYSARGLIAYTNQLGLSSFFAYDPAGRKTYETNANGEDLKYTNSPAGDLLSLTDGKHHTTRWSYDEYGRVTNKLDQAGSEILRYSYDAGNRLTNRWSTAKGNTAYSYDPVGNLTNINYPSSPDVAMGYDALNRLTRMVDASGTNSYSYTAGGQLWTEDGPFANVTVTNSYQNRLRTGLALQQGSVGTPVWTNLLVYDAAGRVTNITSQAGSFVYRYYGGLSCTLVAQLLLPNSSYITNTHDSMGRMAGTWLRRSDSTLLDLATYGYDTAGQRITFTNAAGTRVGYQYDNIGQLKVADSSDNTEDRGYTYDKGWNLNYLTNNGTVSVFGVDFRNQLYAAAGTECGYDGNGNLVQVTNSMVTSYFYDDENRLTLITNGPPAVQPPPQPLPQLAPQLPQPGGGWKAEFTYDGLGRLRVRKDYFAYSSGYSLTNTTWYIYDGYRVIQERNASNVPTVSYTRGLDLSGTLEGAGGIGGLLARSSGYSSGNWTSHAHYHADGNGNITCLVDSSQAVAASYRYDPFGNLISKSGTLADANLYRFSSKEFHVNSGLYYYLYRFYQPEAQRWVNRDPLSDIGSPLWRSVQRSQRFQLIESWENPNLYQFIHNEPLTGRDSFGLLRNCIAENIACNRKCRRNPCPWEDSESSERVNKWKRVAYCEKTCQADFMACEAENAAEIAAQMGNWCARHPITCIGIVVIIIEIFPKPVPAI